MLAARPREGYRVGMMHRSFLPARVLLPLTVAAALGGCKPDEVVLVPFSQVAEAEVYVAAAEADCPPGPTEPVEIFGTTSVNNVVGYVAITSTIESEPKDVVLDHCAVLGTPLVVVVSLANPEAHDAVVQGATLVVVPDGDEEGQVSFDLVQDSADPSQWVVDLDAHGETGRTDLFQIQLLQAEAAD